MTNTPFIYKYQPKLLDEFEISNDFKQMIRTLLDMDNMNILFIGNSGSGKTTLIQSLLSEYYKDDKLINDNNVLFINNLKDQGIQYYRTDVKTFCQTKSNVKKTIVLDDIDLINDQSQQVFRNCIDKYGSQVHFLCSCTNTQKVIESLQSRINCIKIKALAKDGLTKILENIIEKEEISISDDAKQFIVDISNNSARILINYLEKLKLLNQDITKDLCIKICTNISFTDFDNYTKFCQTGDERAAIMLLKEINKKGFSVMDILDNYFIYLKWTSNLNDTIKYEITKLIMKYISIFHNIHEDEIELALFTNNLIFLFSIDIYKDVASNI